MKYLEYILLAILALGLFYAIARRPNWSTRQRTVKLGLHLLLLVLLFGLLRNPSWSGAGGAVLVYDPSVPQERVKEVLAERNLSKSISASRYFAAPEAGEEVVLLGQGFSAEQLSHLSGRSVAWEAYYPQDRPQELRWSANLRRGLQQIVSGRIHLSAPRTLRLKYAGLTLDSTVLDPGYTAFALAFPVQTEGRTALELWVDQEKVKDILFYARPMEKQRVSIVEDFPNMEHRILAEWLGRRGHEVNITTPVAKDQVQQAQINKSSGTDLIISSSPRYKEGTSLLVLGTGASLNAAAGTSFQLYAGTDTEPFEGEVEQFKHRPVLKENQFQVGKLPVYVEQRQTKVGLSLLTETFPAKLSGDTLLYHRIWSEILGAMSSPDSLWLQGPIHAFDVVKAVGFYAADTGWVTQRPYGEIYVESDPAASLISWLKANDKLSAKAEENRKYLGDTWKYLAILFTLGLVWLEPKFKY